MTLHRNILQHNSLALVNKYLAQIDNFSFSCQSVGLLNLTIRLIHIYSVLVKVVLVLRKFAWADPRVITITTQESAHATLRRTRTTLLVMTKCQLSDLLFRIATGDFYQSRSHYIIEKRYFEKGKFGVFQFGLYRLANF